MRLVTTAFLACLLAACTTPPPPAPPVDPARYAAIVAAPDRAAADRRNDERRKPVETLAFVGVQPGMVVADISAGRGYTSELLARAVGPSGKVYAQRLPPPANAPTPPPPTSTGPAPMPTLAQRTANPALAGVLVPVVRPFDDPVPAEAHGRLDLVTLMFNYHDFGHMGVDRTRLNRAVFEALKPGGSYVIADHSGRPGTGISESGTLHRVEEAFVVREVEAAGFRLERRGDFLRNPNDPRDRETPEPAMPKDEFVLRFVKP
ncbi:class I SAM-dependent methyltransferase [Ramlibacter algicola]|uniref:Class I SAM-dependent methyltransferase n=1 Tax=Ramlibacter algicola TaxID=2795217 RepID=A0A934Q0I2_9BURK|nr:class I SAM-dependent methyltransferase [Ramlibacter algicola]MBK0393965.1 class I SAM-dependent methyltransferase [Ramlibacter algicola]